ncbi:hypothetical protein [Bacillus sp. FJAT-22090]|uniref:hypothetical protein n=1 Tax=Bacillus sp. FJAT-22090 TaxID=1581038 RepID=UPI00119F76B8|nr:hypothetical protein [Bacillus sp. FJAT-22090]
MENTYYFEVENQEVLTIRTNANERQWKHLKEYLNNEIKDHSKENIIKEIKSFRNILEIEID